MRGLRGFGLAVRFSSDSGIFRLWKGGERVLFGIEKAAPGGHRGQLKFRRPC